MRISLAGPLYGQGGIQSHLCWLTRMLLEEGWEVLVLSTVTADGERWELPPELDQYLTLIAPPEASQGNTFWQKLWGMAQWIHSVRRFEPDVYFYIGTGLQASLMPLFLHRRVRCIFHEVMGGVPLNWRDSRWIVKRLFDEVVGQSPRVAQTFAQSFTWTKPLQAIAAIPEPLELTGTLPTVFPHPIPKGKIRAALFSRLVPHKRALALVQHWSWLSDGLQELHIYGSGPEESLIREYITAQGLGDRLHCFGRYPTGQGYIDLLSQYDLTLLPTVGSEGAPLVLLESMACGVPFVAFGAGGIPDYGTDNPDVVIVPLHETPKTRYQAYQDALASPWIAPLLPHHPHPHNASTQEMLPFLAGVRQMIDRLSQGHIHQTRLQQFYLEHYGYQVLKRAWTRYLKTPET